MLGRAHIVVVRDFYFFLFLDFFFLTRLGSALCCGSFVFGSCGAWCWCGLGSGWGRRVVAVEKVVFVLVHAGHCGGGEGGWGIFWLLTVEVDKLAV